MKLRDDEFLPSRYTAITIPCNSTKEKMGFHYCNSVSFEPARSFWRKLLGVREEFVRSNALLHLGHRSGGVEWSGEISTRSLTCPIQAKELC